MTDASADHVFGGAEGMENLVRVTYLAMRIGAKREILTGTPAQQRVGARRHLKAEADRQAARNKKAENDNKPARWRRGAIVELLGPGGISSGAKLSKTQRYDIRVRAAPVLEELGRGAGWPSDDTFARQMDELRNEEKRN